ncbi:hypothetical protein DITRI_Ditri01bG0191800 [Diplodiscus trichospermus]
MELQVYVSLFFTFLFLFTVVRTLKKTKTNKSTVKLPPGPWKLPIIGNIHQLISSSLPHQTLSDLATKYGPLMHIQLGEIPAIVVSSANIAEQVLKTNDIIFAERPHVFASDAISYNSKAILFTPYGNYWRQMRKICTMELLSATRVQSFHTIREEEVSDFIKSIALNEGSPINLSEKIFSLSYGVTARAALGKKSKGQDEFIRIITEAVELTSGFSLADMFPSIEVLKLIIGLKNKVKKVHQASDRILEDIVNEHKEKRNRMMEAGNEQAAERDLVDVLLNLQEQGDLEFPLANDNIKAVIQDMFGAGSETTATTIEWVMSELLKNPKLMERAQNEIRGVFGENGRVDEEKIQELKFLRSIVKETLRLHPPAVLIMRECRENCVINGYDIPAKTRVLIDTWAIGRDPLHWKDPEKFCPERFLDTSIDFRGTNFGYIPFGAGRRTCPGILFGIPSVELPLANLLFHFDWKLRNAMKPEDLDMTEAYGLTVRRKNDLFVIPIPSKY